MKKCEKNCWKQPQRIFWSIWLQWWRWLFWRFDKAYSKNWKSEGSKSTKWYSKDCENYTEYIPVVPHYLLDNYVSIYHVRYDIWNWYPASKEIYCILNWCHLFVRVCGLFEWNRIFRCFFFIVVLYIYCCCRFSYQRGKSHLPILSRHIFVCPKPEPEFPMTYFVVF